mmetsp:Transcript_5765/g.8908  ORF Transcript_5765/g.8908 Transcript_5765/m.8908 type:complete len:271 (+) Transcript_5765:1196-2008(+)
MNLAHSSGRSGTHPSAYIPWSLLVLVQFSRSRHQTWIDVGIRSHVLWFLLRPHNLGVVVFGAVFGSLVKCEGGDLFQTDNGDIFTVELLTFGEEFVINLASTEHQGLYVIGVVTDFLINLVKSSMKNGSSAHIIQGRNTQLIPQQILGRYNDQWLTKITMDLPPQAVEIIRWCGAVHNLPIRLLDLVTFISCHFGNMMRILFHHLEVPFNTTGGVLGALSIISMGKEHNKSTLPQPLVLTSGNELIHYHLSSVDEITKLSLPKNECVGVL